MSELEEDLAEVIESVWTTSLGMETERISNSHPIQQSQTIAARVELKGEYQGTLVLECPEGLVRLAAADMLYLVPESATEDDLYDTLGELINVIAGNARGLFEGTTGITLPTVDSANETRYVPEQISGEVRLLCSGFSFRLLVLDEESAS